MVTRCSCIASSSADCVLGGVRLISSARTILAKIGPGANTICRRPVAGVFLHQVGAGDVGRHQVGRELNARELQLEHLRHGVNQQRLRQTRRADDQAVAADEQRVQHLVDDLVLPDDDLAQLAEESASRPAFILSASWMSSGDSRSTTSLASGHGVSSLRGRSICAPSRVLISRVFSARSVTSFSSSLWYFAGSMLSLSSRSDSTRCSRSRCSRYQRAQLRVGRQRHASARRADRQRARRPCRGGRRRRIGTARFVAVVVEQRVLGRRAALPCS